MTDDLAILYQVQQADTELAQLHAAVSNLDSGNELATQVEAMERELAGLREQQRATESEQGDCDLELKTLEEKKAKFESELYGGAVRNPRQLSDLQGEVAMLSREIGKVEDRVLGLMESQESGRSAIEQRERDLKELREGLASVRARHDEASGRLREEIAELEERRRERSSQVSSHLLKRYEQIRVRQGNLGLVKVAGATCPGCRIALPSETVKGLKGGRQDLTCENCGRLLFYEREG